MIKLQMEASMECDAERKGQAYYSLLFFPLSVFYYTSLFSLAEL